MNAPRRAKKARQQDPDLTVSDVLAVLERPVSAVEAEKIGVHSARETVNQVLVDAHLLFDRARRMTQ